MRRTLTMGLGLLAMAGLLSPCAPARAAAEPRLVAQEWGAIYDSLGLDDPQPPIRITGVVFLDRNGNGERDPDEKGIPEACVSDGARVVKTGADGSFVLDPVTPGLQRFVFVSTPTGFRIGGSFYRKIPVKTGDLQCHFPLSEDPESNQRDHTFGHLTDLHGGGADEIELVNAESVRFAVVTGDIVNDAGRPQEFAAIVERLKKATVPVMPLPGNHDLLATGSGALVTRAWLAQAPATAPNPAPETREDESAAEGPKVYEDFFGPAYYSFNYGGRHYVLLNSVAELDRQREWLSRDLAVLPEGTDILVFQHYPPDREQSDFLASHSVRAVFFGHTHTDMVAARGAMLLVNTAGPGNRDLSPRTVRIVRFDGPRIELANHTPGYGDQSRLPPLPDGSGDGPRPAVEVKQEWPQYRGDAARASCSRDAVAPPFAVAWTRSLGGSAYFGSPVLAQGRLYVGIGDRENRDVAGVYALEPATGKVWWRQKAKSFPVIGAGAGRIAVCEREATVRTISAATGDPAWSTELGDPALFRQYAAPLVWEGTLFAGNGKHFTALDAASGKPLWRFPDVGAGFWPNFAAPALIDGKVLLVVPGGVHLLDAVTGAALWTAGDVPVNTINPQTPALAGNTAYLASQGVLYALDLGTGAPRWKARTGAASASPAVDDSAVYIAGDAAVLKLDAETGAEVWRSVELDEYQKKRKARLYFSRRILASPVIAGTHLHVATTDGQLATLDASTGRLLHVLELGRPFVASPIVSGNAVFLASYDGTVFALVSVASPAVKD